MPDSVSWEKKKQKSLGQMFIRFKKWRNQYNKKPQWNRNGRGAKTLSFTSRATILMKIGGKSRLLPRFQMCFHFAYVNIHRNDTNEILYSAKNVFKSH